MTMSDDNVRTNIDDNVVVGPDLNKFKSPLDEKVYRQVLLPNGLRAVLISDTIAMRQNVNEDDDEGDKLDGAVDEGIDKMDGIELEQGEDHGKVDEESCSSEESECEDKDEDGDGLEEDSNGDDTDKNDGSNIRNAACMIIVGAGSYYDPVDCQGLAHFLEHLLFMGSEKYPSENDFSNYLNKHGGYENAFTEEEYTAYYFSIPQEYLFGALDRLAHFFVSPLMLESAVDRELKAIESEFQLKKNSDAWRLNSLLSLTCGSGSIDPDNDASSSSDNSNQNQNHHPFSVFSLGNLKSLKEMPESKKINTMERLRTFFNNYYYALNMRVVLIGGYPLDILQSNVVNSLSGIPARPRQENCQHPIPIKSENNIVSWDSRYESPMKQYGLPLLPQGYYDPTVNKKTNGINAGNNSSDNVKLKIYHVVPVRTRHSMTVTWQLPSQIGKWKTKPSDYISNLIGHEGSGSLLSSLKEKSLATDCYVGIGSSGIEYSSFHALFQATFILSEKGVENWHVIVSELYQYIGMLNYHCVNNTFPSYIFDELKMIQEIAYKYGDEPDPDDIVERIGENCAPHYNMPPERLLDATDLYFEYDPQSVQDVLQYITPATSRIDLMTSMYGRSSDYDRSSDNDKMKSTGQNNDINICDEKEKMGVVLDSNIKIEPRLSKNTTNETFPPPLHDPWFGTYYWAQYLSSTMTEQWTNLAQPQLPPNDSLLRLPPKNPFVPTKLDLKPGADSGTDIEESSNDVKTPRIDQSLLFCVLKLVAMEENKVVDNQTQDNIYATVIQCNISNNRILLCYHKDDSFDDDLDERRQWHDLDSLPSSDILSSKKGSEGTLDNRAMRFCVVSRTAFDSIIGNSDNIVNNNGGSNSTEDKSKNDGVHQESDKYENKKSDGFPTIPPALPPSHLPLLLSNTRLLKLWHLQDKSFTRPIAELRLQLFCSNANKTPLHRACADLMMELCADALTETSYMASICELGWTIESADIGFNLRVFGFDDKLIDFFGTIFKLLLSFCRSNKSGQLPSTIQTGRFDACLEILRRKYANSGMSSAKLSSNMRLLCILPTRYSSFQKTAAIENISIALFMNNVTEILSDLTVEAFFHGNVTKADAEQLKLMIFRSLASPSCNNNYDDKEEHPREKLLWKPVTKIPYYVAEPKPLSDLSHSATVSDCKTAVIAIASKDPTESNTAIEIYFQVGKDNIVKRVVIDMLVQLMAEPLFDQIRTKDQFGYSVSCDSRWTHGVMGIYFSIVTASKSASAATKRINQFLVDYRQTLLDMSETVFSEQLNGLVKGKLEMFNCLSDENSTLWIEICERKYDFEKKRHEAMCLRSLRKSHVLKAFDEWLNPTSRKRRMMTVHVIGGDITSDSCLGRPPISPEKLGSYVGETVHNFITDHCKQQTWGRIY